MTTTMYDYSQFNDFNRFVNLDGVESKIIGHLLTSTSKYADLFWKILKYDTKDALSRPSLSLAEKTALVSGPADNPEGGITENTRLFLSPFVDDAWTKQSSSVYIFVNDIYPIDHTRASVSVTVETVVHARINTVYGDADVLANPETNPNDYFYKDGDTPSVPYKSRATVLLKCILAELNGLYIDGVGYLQFNTDKLLDGLQVRGRASLSLFNGRSFFGHSVNFNLSISGVSDSDEVGF